MQVCQPQRRPGRPAAPLSWRQDAALSGFNMLTLGIVHETLLRWVPPPVRVLAQVHAFIAARIDPQSGVRRPVGTPDSVQVLAVLANGARAIYHFSGVDAVRPEMRAFTCSAATACCTTICSTDRIRGASRPRGTSRRHALADLRGDPDSAGEGPRLAASRPTSSTPSARARRSSSPTFATGVAYMEFTEAVARSAETGEAIELPLQEFVVGSDFVGYSIPRGFGSKLAGGFAHRIPRVKWMPCAKPPASFDANLRRLRSPPRQQPPRPRHRRPDHRQSD